MVRTPQIAGHVILAASELAALKRDKEDALRQLEAVRKRCEALERELERFRRGEAVRVSREAVCGGEGSGLDRSFGRCLVLPGGGTRNERECFVRALRG